MLYSNEDNGALLLVASIEGDYETVCRLLKEGANVNYADNYGITPLYVASQNGHFEVVRELLVHGAVVDNAGYYDTTPLYAASKKAHFDVVMELLMWGAKVKGIAEDENPKPLYIAKSKRYKSFKVVDTVETPT
jgi:hypothetical protein